MYGEPCFVGSFIHPSRIVDKLFMNVSGRIDKDGGASKIKRKNEMDISWTARGQEDRAHDIYVTTIFFWFWRQMDQENQSKFVHVLFNHENFMNCTWGVDDVFMKSSCSNNTIPWIWYSFMMYGTSISQDRKSGSFMNSWWNGSSSFFCSWFDYESYLHRS